MSCATLVGKLEGKVPTMTVPSRSTVKLPDGNRTGSAQQFD